MAQQVALLADMQSMDDRDNQYHDWIGVDLSFAAVLVDDCDIAIGPNQHRAIVYLSHTIVRRAVATVLDVQKPIVSMKGPAKMTVTIARRDCMAHSHGDFSVVTAIDYNIENRPCSVHGCSGCR